MFRVVVALLLVCSVLAGVSPVGGAGLDSADVTTTLTSDPAATASLTQPRGAAAVTQTLDLTATYQLTPSRPGEVLVTLHYDIPSAVTAVETRLPENATVMSTTRFTREAEDRYVWQETGRSAELTYRLTVNETAGGRLPLAAEGKYLFVDPGPWALFRTPKTGTRWEWRGGDVRLTQTAVTDGGGVVGEQLVFLGAIEEYHREANGQQFRLVVPTAATLTESPDAILDSYADAAGRLNVGDRDERVLVIAAPTERVEWGVHGLQTGDSDMWVRDAESLSTPNNVWLHEYVHSRQSYQPAPEVRWFTEGSATYYAALLTLEQGHIGYGEFESWLALGATDRGRQTVLAQPETWGTEGNYRTGALVAGALDYRIRAASDASLATVFSEMNAYEGTLTEERLQRFVLDASNQSVRADAERYITTDTRPETWTFEEHRTQFGPFAGHVTAGFAVDAETPAEVTGPYRNRSVVESAGVLVVPNETLSVPVRVENDGGRTTEYNLTFTAGEGVSHLTGSLDPGASRVERVNRTFTEIGTYTLTVGTETYTVFVREPAQAQVTDVSVTPSEVAVDEPVTVRATVTNDGARPGEVTVAFTLDGDVVDRTRVTLDAGGETTVSTTVVLVEPGRAEVGADGQAVAVEVVTTDTPTATATEESDEQTEAVTSTSTPGFGAAVAVGAVALVAVALARTVRQRQ